VFRYFTCRTTSSKQSINVIKAVDMSLDQARRFLKQLEIYPRREENGYDQVLINGEWRWVHRIIAREKMGSAIFDGFEVHHIDGDKKNNDPSNLQVLSKDEHQKLHEKLKIEDNFCEIDQKARLFIRDGIQHVLNRTMRSEEGFAAQKNNHLMFDSDKEVIRSLISNSDFRGILDMIDTDINVSSCSRCGGTGYLPIYSHIEGGVCFACDGSGKN
jgi:hypothetical protein